MGRYGVEAETAPRDAQALARRLALKLRDGGTDGVLLVLPRTRRVREFLAVARPDLDAAFAIPGTLALSRLVAGVDPGGSAIIMLPSGADSPRLRPPTGRADAAAEPIQSAAPAQS